MIEKLLVYERDAFFMLNGSNSPFLDQFMWLYSSKVVWFPLAAFILCVLIYKKNWREWLLILLAIVIVVTLCDQFASHVCKPIFMRWRPTHHPDFMDQVKVVFDYRGGRYGFISSHAANSFGFATLMSLLFRHKLFTYSVFFWAVLSSYSRIYLGVHFITDVIPGMIAGLFFGYITYKLYMYVRPKFVSRAGEMHPSALYTVKSKNMIVYAIWITILILLVFNQPLVSCIR